TRCSQARASTFGSITPYRPTTEASVSDKRRWPRSDARTKSMHELSVALSIVEAVEEEAARHPGPVGAIHLRLGPLAGVIKEALLSAWELACESSGLTGVRLVVEDVPIVVYCPTCGSNQQVVSMQWLCCACCDTPAREIVQGRELEIRA